MAEGLRSVEKALSAVLESMVEMRHIDGAFFYHNLRRYLLGLDDVVFVGTAYRARAQEGGSTGNDATYQAIEYALGIDFAQAPPQALAVDETTYA